MSEERMNPNFNLESCLRNKINEAKRYLEDKHKIQKDDPCEESSYAESFIYYFQNVETLLDLYQQEKENNKWLLKAFDESRKNNIELAHEYIEYKNSNISKDKIKEKLKYAIEMRDFYLSTEPKHILVTLYNERINLCNELLKED